MTASVQAQPLFDVAVVGAGPVGLTMAATLVGALPGIAVALVAPAAQAGGEGDPRASAVAAGARNMLEAIGVWAKVSGEANPVDRMVLTDSAPGDLARPHLLELDGQVAPGEPMAHMVPNGAMAAALEGLVGGGITRFEAAVEAFSADAQAATLGLADGAVLRARLVIAADGGRSRLRALAGIGVWEHDYRQAGVVTNIAHALPHRNTAFQHFLASGPFASLPLPGDVSSLVWAETPERAEALCGMGADMVAREIEAAMGSALGRVTLVSHVRRFPLALRLARSFAGQRIALIGDAAHVIHPLAGQGLNLGLKDVAALAECLADGLRIGLDAGDPAIMRRYEQWRRGDTAMMAAATDGLNRLFSNDNAPLRLMRDAGLATVERLGPLKAAFVDLAAGTGGPKLLRGERI